MININTLFASLGQFILGKTVESQSRSQNLRYIFCQYGPPGPRQFQKPDEAFSCNCLGEVFNQPIGFVHRENFFSVPNKECSSAQVVVAWDDDEVWRTFKKLKLRLEQLLTFFRALQTSPYNLDMNTLSSNVHYDMCFGVSW